MEVLTSTKKKNKGKYNNSLGKKIFIISVLTLPLINFLVFTVYCNIGGVGLSMMDLKGTKEIFVGFENYKRFFRLFVANDYDDALFTSLKWLPILFVFVLPMTLFLSFFLYKKVPFSKVSIVLLFLPNIIPAAVITEFYKRLWDGGGGITEAGLFFKLFSFVGGGTNWLISTKYANYALWIYTVWFGFGINSLLIWGAMSRIPVELVESAELDGATQFKEFLYITIPVIWPTLEVVIIIYALSPFTIYSQPLMLAQNGMYGTLTLKLLAINQLKINQNPYFAAAINLLIACVSIPLSIILRKVLDKAYTVAEI